MTNHHLRTLSEVIRDLKTQGYAADFIYRENKLMDMGSGKSYDAREITILKEYRFEGNTNPDDMSILYSIETVDGTKGTISTAYGANANTELDEFLNEAVWEA